MHRDLRRGDIVRIRDERWRVRHHLERAAVAIVDVCGCDRSNRGVRARFLLPFETFERLPSGGATRVVSRRRWRHLARQVLAGAVPEYDSLRTLAGARIDILPFQLEPALAAVRGVACRILIADAVGLGKTVQAGLIIAELLERRADARALIVCPAALRDQWSDELARRFGLDPARFDSTTLARSGSVPAGVNPWTAHRLIVTSVDYVKRPEVLRALETLVWDLVVVDEAHGLAGRSERFRASTVLGERARTLVLLTATPHSGDEDAFRRLCGVGDIRGRFPLAVFRRTRDDVALPSSRRTLWLDVALTPSERAMHRALEEYARLVARQHPDSAAAARLAMIVLLRRGCSSASALARSLERRLRFLPAAGEAPDQPPLPFDDGTAADDEPSGELAAPGLAIREDERQLLRGVLTLAQEAAREESKVRAIRRLLRRTREQAIVFTEYRDTLDTLSAALAGVECVALHGSLSAADRRDALHQFACGRRRVLLATDAASEGLNLHERCRLVVDLELPWNPLRLEQRVGRVDRIGQVKRVHQVVLVAAGTAEQTVVAHHLRQRRIRADRTLAALRPDGHSEREIAARVLGRGSSGSPRAGTTAAAVLPEGIFVADLRPRAHEEAAAAVRARRLDPGDLSAAQAVRPFGTSFSRGATRGCWVFTIALTTSDGELLCESLLGIWYADSTPRPTTARLLGQRLDVRQRELLALVQPERTALFARLAAAVRSSAAAAIAREQAIVESLEHRRAHLATALAQRALFDRRIERESTVRREVLNEALAGCRDRLARLERSLCAGPVAVEPAFALILR